MKPALLELSHVLSSIYPGKFSISMLQVTVPLTFILDGCRMVWSTEEGKLVYEGQYVEDAKHGSGRFEWPDGGVYEGEWYHGRMQGLGWYTDPHGDRRQGEWVADQILRWIDEPKANALGQNGQN